jgi:tetratricopeptide (TPR) repeat protein
MVVVALLARCITLESRRGATLSGKKDKELNDLEKFFGDDADWLSDDASEDLSDASKPPRLSVAPPDAPYVAPATAGRFGPAAPPMTSRRRPPMPTLPPTAGVWEELGLDRPALGLDKKVETVRETFEPPAAAASTDAPAPILPESASTDAKTMPAPAAEAFASVPPPPSIALPPPPRLDVLPPDDDARLSSRDPFSEEIDLGQGRPVAIRVPTPAPAEPEVAAAPFAPPPLPSLPPVQATASPLPFDFEEGAAVQLNFTPRSKLVEADPSTLQTVTDGDLARRELSPTALSVPPEPAFDTEPPTQEDAILEPDPEPVAPLPPVDFSAPVPTPPELTEDTTVAVEPVEPVAPPVPSLESEPEPLEAAPLAPPVPVAPLEQWTPRGDEQAWREAATSVVAEAALASGEERGRLLFLAGQLYEHRLGDRLGAETMYADAVASGFSDATLSRAMAALAQDAGRSAEAADHWLAVASSASGLDAVEALLACAALQSAAPAIATLARAHALDPEHYGVLCSLRDRLAEAGRDNEREAICAKIAALLEGRAAADAWWEVGRLSQRAGRHVDALAAFERARGADASHAPSLLAMESLYRGANEASLDSARLVSAWVSEGARLGGADEGWYAMLAAARSADPGAVLNVAVTSGFPFAIRQLQAYLARTGDVAGLAASLRQEGGEASGPMRAWAMWRLGLVLQEAGDVEGAIQAFDQALLSDADATPAARALDAALARAGREQERQQRAEARAVAGTGVAALSARHAAIRLARRRGEHAQARAQLDAILSVTPQDRVAIDAACAVCVAQGDYAGLSLMIERRIAVATPDESAILFLLALAARAASTGTSWDLGLLQAAVDASAVVRAAVLPWLPGVGGDALAAAADVAGDASGAALRCAAAMAWLDAGEPAKAVVAVERALTDAPDSPAAMALAEELVRAGFRVAVGEGAVVGPWERVGRAWPSGTLGSADTTALISAFESDPTHPVAGAALLGAALERQDGDLAIEFVRVAMPGATGDGRTALLVWAALQGELLDDADMVLEAVGAISEGSIGVPTRGLARSAEARQEWGEAARWLAESNTWDDRLHVARLYAQRLGKAVEASAIAVALMASDDAAARGAGASVSAMIAQSRNDFATLGEAYRVLASLSSRSSVRSVTASWAARLLPADGAAAAWWMALDAAPGAAEPFEALRRSAIGAGDGAGLRTLYQKLRPSDLAGLADALSLIGDWSGASEAWGEAECEPLVRWMNLEVCRGHLNDWSGVYDALSRRRELVRDEATRDAIDAKRRWLLAEKLAETDLAWDLYRQLHDDRPGDREITESLARIAAARGETALGIQYLRELAETAPSPMDSARYQCRIAVVWEALADPAAARQAYLDALDHVRDDQVALDGLRRLARQSGDHGALVAVLQREAGLVSGAQKLSVLREIAHAVEAHADDRWVAVDAWRSVTEFSPGDREALEHLVSLSEGLAAWDQFLESGRALLPALSESDRPELQRRLGEACEKAATVDEAISFYEASMSAAVPNSGAARRLEALARSRGDWVTTARCLRMLASHAEGQQRTDLLLACAQVEAEARQDRDAADATYAEVLALDPACVPALRYRAEYLLQAGRPAEALPVFERLEPTMLTEDSDDFDVRLEVGSFFSRFADLLRDAGRSVDALARYERALSLNPTHLPSLRAVGPIYFERNDWKNVEKTWRQWLQLTGGQGAPDEVAEVYLQLGVAERELGGSDKAYRRFAKALEANPNHVGALKAMAKALEERSDWSNLLNVFNNIIYHAQVAEDVVHAYLTKGRVLDERMNRIDKAVQHYEGALAIDAENVVALVRMAEIALRKGSWSEAAVLAGRGLLSSQPDAALRADLNIAVALAKQMQGDSVGSSTALAAARALDASRVPEVLEAEAVKAELRRRLPLG